MRSEQLITQDGEILATGNGGNVTIATQQLIVKDGAQVLAGTRSKGNGGNITVNASDFIQLSGVVISPKGEEIPSGLFARSREGSGNAGNLEINTPTLIIQNGATTTVSSALSTGANAGNLTINAPTIRLNNGIITAETNAGNQGNIFLNTEDLRIRRQSNITTDATGPATGGNITINADTIVALENSDIRANSQQSFGGQVIINTQGLFRQGFGVTTDVDRNSSDFTSDITASSNLGPQFDGVVDINTPDINPTQGLIELPAIGVPQVAENPCVIGGKESTFNNVGRGGLPPNPREAINLGIMGINSSVNTQESPIIKAEGWVQDANGIVTLVASTPKPTPVSFSPPSTGCGFRLILPQKP